MIKFHIPGFATQIDINDILINLLNKHKEYFYKDISISSIYGAFTPCIWNGGRIISGNYQNEYERAEIIKHYNDMNIGVILTFTNTLLDSRAYADYICNKDIALLAERSDINKIIVADEGLYQYISNNYSDKNIKFILSTTSDVVIDGNMKDLEQYEDKYEYIVPNYNKNNTEELFNVKHPEKYEILVNPQCMENCKLEKEHYKSISNNNINSSSIIDSFICPYETNTTYDLIKLKQRRGFVNVNDLYGKYKEKGFDTFKINGRTAGTGDIVAFYMYYMVKPKYIEKACDAFKEHINADYFNYIKEELLNNEQSSQ